MMFSVLLLLSVTACTDPYAYKDLAVTPQRPQKLCERVDGSVLADFGKDAVGWLELRNVVSGVYEIVVGEMTNAYGHVTNAYPMSTIRMHSYAGPVIGSSWRMPFPVDKLNTTGWDPKAPAIRIPERIGRISPFRYVEIVRSPSAVTPSNVVRHAVHYPIDMTQSMFESENEGLNAVYEMCKYSVWATSFCGVYVDGDRERTPYEADAYINQLCQYAIDADCSLARKSHEWLMDHPTWPTEWKQHSIKMAWADWMWTGDTRSLVKYYERLKIDKLYAGFSARADGLLVTTPGTNSDPHDIVDYPPEERDCFVMTSINAVVNAFHYSNLLEMVDIARAIGRMDDARMFERQAEKVRVAYLKTFRDEADKLYVDGEGCSHKSLHAGAIALAFGLVPKNEMSVVADFIEKKGMSCSVYFAQYLLEALFVAGRDVAAMKLMTSSGDRSWQGMIDFGSTVSMEAWNMHVKPNQDLNHIWGAVPLNMIARRVLGVTPLEPGFERILIRPQAGGLKRFHGVVPTAKGLVCVKVNGTRLEVSLPAPARIEWRDRVHEVSAGSYCF